MNPVVCVSYTGVDPIIIRADVLDVSWLESIHHRPLVEIRSASDKS